jgi:hypothetical protein
VTMSVSWIRPCMELVALLLYSRMSWSQPLLP